MRSGDELTIQKKLIEAVKLDDPKADDALWNYLYFTALKTFRWTVERFGIDSYAILGEVVNRARNRIRDESFDPNEKSFLPWVLELARNTAIEYYRQTRGQDDPRSAPASLTEFEKALRESDFTLFFSSDLSNDQVKGTLEAVADYYRACGGVGFEVDFDSIEITDRLASVV